MVSLMKRHAHRRAGPLAPPGHPRTAPDIVVSVLAELTAVRQGYRVPSQFPAQRAKAAEAGCVR